MKIENNGLNPLSSQKTDAAYRAEKKAHSGEVQATGSKHDRAEVSENARLLAKARVALDGVEEADESRLEALQKQIQEGTYSIPHEEIAARLFKRLFP